MMRLTYLFLLPLFVGCAAQPTNILVEQPRGEVLVSITTIEGAFHGPIRNKTGFEFYIDYSRKPEGVVTGYEYRDGDIVEEIWGGDLASDDFVSAFRKVNFQPFEYETERKAAYDLLRGAGGPLWVTADGWVYRILVNTDNGPFVLEDWNPGTEIRTLAPYSEKISKLKSILELVNGYYGEIKIGVL